jgi:hypothetical protein
MPLTSAFDIPCSTFNIHFQGFKSALRMGLISNFEQGMSNVEVRGGEHPASEEDA